MADFNDLLREFDAASFAVEDYERLLKMAAQRRAEMVRKMLEIVTIEELSGITGLRIIRLRQLEAKR